MRCTQTTSEPQSDDKARFGFAVFLIAWPNEKRVSLTDHETLSAGPDPVLGCLGRQQRHACGSLSFHCRARLQRQSASSVWRNYSTLRKKRPVYRSPQIKYVSSIQSHKSLSDVWNHACSPPVCNAQLEQVPGRYIHGRHGCGDQCGGFHGACADGCT